MNIKQLTGKNLFKIWLFAGLAMPCVVFGAEKETFKADIVTWACERSQSTIVIDGQLDDAAWSQAKTINGLYECRNPNHGGAIKVSGDKLNVKILFDEKNLYIAAVIRDRDIVANPDSPLRADRSAVFLDGDTFEVFIQPGADQPVYYEFHINPLNAQWSMRYPAAQGYMKWTTTEPGFQSAATVSGSLNKLDEDQKWTVEMAIPLSAITGNDGKPVKIVAGAKWRISFCLYDYQFYYDDCGNGNAMKYFSTSHLEYVNFHARKYFSFIEFK